MPARHDPGLTEALAVIRTLAAQIGPRRPCSPREREAGEVLASWLNQRNVDARLEPFRALPTFAWPYGMIFGTALMGGLLEPRRPRAGWLLSSVAQAVALMEGDLRLTPASSALSLRRSANLVASILPEGPVHARVCLCGHMDSTRSGLLFHPRAVRHLPLLAAIPAVSTLLLAARPLRRRLPGAARVRRVACAGLGFSLALLCERELRGVDVAGASDNASGAAVAIQLTAECAAVRLQHTQVDLLVTGCEESGMLGAQAYARGPADRIRGTMFLNFDTIGGDVPLTYVLGEGTPRRRASPYLVSLLEAVARDRPELGLAPASNTPGLPTDATVMMARGEAAVTLLAQGRSVPHYHQPTDVYENVSPAAVGRTLETGRELLRRIDRGLGGQSRQA